MFKKKITISVPEGIYILYNYYLIFVSIILNIPFDRCVIVFFKKKHHQMSARFAKRKDTGLRSARRSLLNIGIIVLSVGLRILIKLRTATPNSTLNQILIGK
jgi:hypothetical protein